MWERERERERVWTRCRPDVLVDCRSQPAPNIASPSVVRHTQTDTEPAPPPPPEYTTTTTTTTRPPPHTVMWFVLVNPTFYLKPAASTVRSPNESFNLQFRPMATEQLHFVFFFITSLVAHQSPYLNDLEPYQN